MSNLVPTPIVDKNGKMTTVHVRRGSPVPPPPVLLPHQSIHPLMTNFIVDEEGDIALGNDLYTVSLGLKSMPPRSFQEMIRRDKFAIDDDVFQPILALALNPDTAEIVRGDIEFLAKAIPPLTGLATKFQETLLLSALSRSAYARNPDDRIGYPLSVAEDPTCPTELLSKVFNQNPDSVSIVQAIADNPSTPPEILATIAGYDYDRHFVAVNIVSNHPQIPIENIITFSFSEKEIPKLFIAEDRYKRVPLEVLERLTNDGWTRIRTAAKNSIVRREKLAARLAKQAK